MAIAAIIVTAALVLAALWLPFFNKKQPIKFGATFSKPYTESMGLDWQEAYIAILDDLRVPYLRLESEWDGIETTEGNYSFTALDWQIAEAEKRGVKVVLVIGNRQPRWPECHTPGWLFDATKTELEERTLDYVKTVVERYKNSPAVEMWQVENEPLLNLFGKCPAGHLNFLQQEIALVKSLDDRPVLITDSGELSTWNKTANLGDYFGTSVYRVVYNSHFGYFYHMFPPSFYRIKAEMVDLPLDRAFISELQAEPWLDGSGLGFSSPEEQEKMMNAEKIKKQADFASRTGFGRAYFWGVEWWYWLKKEGYGDEWQAGKEIFQSAD